MWIEATRRPLRALLDSFAAIVLPSDCRICGDALVRLARIPVCDRCLSAIVPSHLPSCTVCGEALELAAAQNESLCGVCRRVHPHFDLALSYGAYDGSLRKLLHLLKYERLRPAANVIGAKLAQAIAARDSAQETATLVIPVPLHRAKRRQRGFNQAELIARAALRRLGGPGFELHTGNLLRVRPTVSQTGLTRHQRRENVRGAFVVVSPNLVSDREVMIVDDVYTTGTTLNECARVLRTAGARRAVVATVARVYRHAAMEQLRTEGISMQESATAIGRAVAG